MVRLLLSTAAALTLATLASAQEPSYMDTPSYQFRHRVIIAHGYLMGLAFAILFPLGAIILKAFRSKRLIWFHAGWQIFAYCVALAAFGLGVWFTYETDQVSPLSLLARIVLPTCGLQMLMLMDAVHG